MRNLLVVFGLLVCTAAAAEPVKLLVDFKDDATPAQIHETEIKTSLHFVPTSEMFSADKLTAVWVDSSRENKVLAQLNDESDVEVAEEDQVYTADEVPDFDTPNDPQYKLQRWHFDMIGLEKAWKTSTGKGIIVAVLDTGVSDGKDADFPRVGDLAQTKILPGYNFIDDNNRPNDGHGHGSHCASTIAESTNNGLAGVGIAYDASILPVKVLSDSGSGATEGIAEGIRWATDHQANIISMSLGGGGVSDIMKKAVKYATDRGVLVVAAAGNDPSERTHYPAAYPGVLAVSAVGPGGNIGTADAGNPMTAKIASYSSYGSAGGEKGIFIAAPGGDKRVFGEAGGIWQSTIYEDANGPDPKRWALRSFNGTSMSCPAVSGVAALVGARLLETNGKFDAKKVEKILADSATQRNDKLHFGAGILNAAAALEETDSETTSHSVRWVALGGLVLLGVVVLARKKN